jgi:hypothetical protein
MQTVAWAPIHPLMSLLSKVNCVCTYDGCEEGIEGAVHSGGMRRAQEEGLIA